jgi:peptidoglycan/LPS O-acetylase OafA/YrhL
MAVLDGKNGLSSASFPAYSGANLENRATGRAPQSEATTPTGFHLGYRRWLDGLRGLAVLAVLAFHFHLIRGGFLGVDVFLVLSGFLITTLLAQEWQRHGAISLKRFYLRRALRLLPAFAVLLFVCGIVSLFLKSAKDGIALRNEIVVAACYVTNWPALHKTGMPTLAHTWSLSLEEQFYVIWPVLLWGMLRLGLGRGKMLLLVCAGILASALVRAWLYFRYPAWTPEWICTVSRLYTGLDTRADALLVGCLVGLLAVWGLLPKSRLFLLGARLGALASFATLGCMLVRCHMEQRQLYCGYFTAAALMVAVILVRLLSAPSRLGSLILESPFLVGIGRISYALYLVHIPIILMIGADHIGPSHPATTLLAVGLSFAAAVFSYYWIERPFLQLKLRLEASELVAPNAHNSRNEQPVAALPSCGPSGGSGTTRLRPEAA